MLCIRNDSNNPFFNAAAEEYLFRDITDDCFMLYRNRPSIIVGKHQNTLAEINTDFVRKHKIEVVRRLSGGGAVYHDPGNLNFAFFHSGTEGKLVDFERFTKPILTVLHRLSVPARLGEHNDIRVGDRKISGNAEHLVRTRILHHGTLLFSSNLEDLNEALHTNAGHYRDKAVKSVRSRVANITEFLEPEFGLDEFRDMIFQHIMELHEHAAWYEFSLKDKESIDHLVENKYSTWQWNFGYSPGYHFTREIKTGEIDLVAEMIVEKGIIVRTRVRTGKNDLPYRTELEQLLTGIQHREKEIRNRLLSSGIMKYLPSFDPEEFILGLF